MERTRAGMRRLLLLLCAGALTAGCSYVDYERPILRNYTSDLFGAPDQPGEEDKKPAPGSDALAAAFARWQASVGPKREEYRVGPSDTLKVSVLVLPEIREDMSFELVVSAEGDLVCPLLGRVPVAGLSALQVAEKLARLHGKKH